MQISCRDVVLVPFPYRDRLAESTRPALVVSAPGYHQDEDVIVAAITSHVVRFSTDYEIVEWQAAGLKIPSTARMLLATMAKNRILLKVGTLTDTDWQQIQQRLQLVLPH